MLFWRWPEPSRQPPHENCPPAENRVVGGRPLGEFHGRCLDVLRGHSSSSSNCFRERRSSLHERGGPRQARGVVCSGCVKTRCAIALSRYAVAGGSPAATFFFCLPKRRRQEKGTPGSPPLRGALRYSDRRAAAELALARSVRGLRQSSPKAPGSPAFLGGSHGAQRRHHRSKWVSAGATGLNREASPRTQTCYPCH